MNTVSRVSNLTIPNSITTPDDSPSWLPHGEGEHDHTIEKNWLFHLARRRFRSQASGKTHDFYVMDLTSAVHVIAVTEDEKVVMVRQFRAGSGRDSLETPGGLLEQGEDPCDAGPRELLEETGYAGDSPVFLGTVWSNPAITTSRITTILVRNARKVAEPHLDPSEELHVELVPVRMINPMIRDGSIDHALVVSGLLRWIAGIDEASS